MQRSWKGLKFKLQGQDFLPIFLFLLPTLYGHMAPQGLFYLDMRGSFEEKKIMETLAKNNKFNRHIVAGAIVTALGLLLMLDNLGLHIPHWILSWHTVMLAVGLLIGYRKDFKVSGWLVLVIIGGIYTLKDIAFFDFSRFTSAFVLIGLGAYLLLKPAKKPAFWDFSDKKPVDFGNKHAE